jgi:Asp-tRNA(Asn)/Glu-tRNA(Gln) amidotransferase A subunit family amidase
MADLFRLSASEAAARIRDGKFTSEALVRSCLERIDARDSQVKAWVHLDRDFALRQARECDRSANRGPIHGVPFAAKDIMDTADLPTEYGSPIYKGNRPAADAACVALSRAAGGVLLGKTVTTEFASRFPWGKTTNPYNPQHTPGGSSSGSAAAVADFMVPLAFGTQTVGSVIRPAAFCGCIGYKPSFGEVSTQGVKQNTASFVEDIALFRAASEKPDGYGIRRETSGRHSDQRAQGRRLPHHVLGPRGGVHENFPRRGRPRAREGGSEGRRFQSWRAV